MKQNMIKSIAIILVNKSIVLVKCLFSNQTKNPSMCDDVCRLKVDVIENLYSSSYVLVFTRKQYKYLNIV